MRKYIIEGYDEGDLETGVSAIVFAESVGEAWVWAFDRDISVEEITRLDASATYRVEMEFDDGRTRVEFVNADSDQEAYGDAADMAVYLGLEERECSGVRIALVSRPKGLKTDLYVSTAEGGSYALEA